VALAAQDNPLEIPWVAQYADSLDSCNQFAHAVVPQLAQQQLFCIGVPEYLGGAGGTTADAVEAIANVAQHSVAAAFVFWGHRSFIEYLLLSPNESLRECWLPSLLSGETAGATGLSNAIKFLSGIEHLQIQARSLSNDRWSLDGQLPWVTNLRPQGFIVAAVVAREGQAPIVTTLRHDQEGLERTDDLELMGLRGSNTAAIHLRGVEIQREDLLHDNAQEFIARIRPSFLALQCGLSLGLADAALLATEQALRGRADVLTPRIHTLRNELAQRRSELLSGLDAGRFTREPQILFRLRIALAEIVQSATQVELEASGGRAYLQKFNQGFSRRWRESAFIPLVTPSLVQLQGELRKFESVI
jgi:alkylation response protein AidB-like acyl-CoA dehydrogenase